MVRFRENELGVALVTYRRPEFVREWFEKCFSGLIERNIGVTVYDSSDDPQTKAVVESFSRIQGIPVQYVYITDKLSVGHVVWEAIKQAKTDYVWVVGDSRRQSLEELDEKVFPYIKQQYEHIVLEIIDNGENDGKIYTDRHEMIYDCLISMTCTGYYIYRRSIFDRVLNDKNLLEECDSKYKDNYGFTWMGYFLKAYSLNDEYKTVFTRVKTYTISPKKKEVRWNDFFFKCWASDLCNIIDNCDSSYCVSDDLLKKVWKYLAFDMSNRLLINRKAGVLNRHIIEKYDMVINRVSGSAEKIRDYACSREEDLEKCHQYWKENEEKEFVSRINKNIDRIIQTNLGRSICIYGAGDGGKVLLKTLVDRGVKVKTIYDRNGENIRILDGIPVKTLEFSNPDSEILIISFYKAYVPVLPDLLRYGFSLDSVYYINFI